jgi:hypothetical protein
MSDFEEYDIINSFTQLLQGSNSNNISTEEHFYRMCCRAFLLFRNLNHILFCCIVCPQTSDILNVAVIMKRTLCILGCSLALRSIFRLRLHLDVGIECVELNWTSNVKIQLNWKWTAMPMLLFGYGCNW